MSKPLTVNNVVPKYDMVRVLWGDAQVVDRLLETELDRELRQSHGLAPYWSTGFLIRETEETVFVAESILSAQTPEECDEFRRVLVIPKRQIISLTTMIETKKECAECRLLEPEPLKSMPPTPPTIDACAHCGTPEEH